MRRALAPALSLALAASSALAPPSLAADAPPAASASIRIDNFSFAPALLKVARGTKVTWVNADDVPHVVRTEDSTIKSPALDTDDTYSYTFDKAGTYRYFCSLHPKMQGTIVVR